MAVELGLAIQPEPGRAFSWKGRTYFYATESRILLEVKSDDFRILRGLLGGASYEDVARELNDLSLAEVHERVRSTVRAYVDRGLLRAPDLQALARATETREERLLRHQPRRMMLLVSQTCNMRCDYCYAVDRAYEDAGSLMLRETAMSAVDYLLDGSPQRRNLEVFFFGGEPLLNLGVIKSTVTYARSKAKGLAKSVYFGLTTNGTLLSESTARYLVENDFQIVLSIDGPASQHDAHRRMRGGGSSHHRALRGLRRLRAAGARVGQVKIRATMSHRHHDPMPMASFFDSIGVRNYGIGSAVPRAGAAQPTDLT